MTALTLLSPLTEIWKKIKSWIEELSISNLVPILKY